ncbi:MAG: TPM domain-containing protein [Hyphomicrobium sp.]
MPAAQSALPPSRALAALAIWLALVLCSSMPPSAAAAEPALPALTGRIVDEAGLLSPEARTAIEARLAALEQKSTDQLAVVTLRSLQGYPIEDYGYRLGRKWGIGQKEKDNGVLLIVAPSERKVRIEVGRGLEPILTDAMTKLIIENAILPEFRRGDFAAGITAGVRDINDVLLGDAEEVKQRARTARNDDTLDFWSIVLIIFWICVVLFVFFSIVQSIRNAPQAVPGQRRRGPGGPVIVPGGWGGGWSGGDGGGGGWSGGGGGFGGGGSSGSW